MANENILPSSLMKNPTGVVRHKFSIGAFEFSKNFAPLYCGCCGKDSGTFVQLDDLGPNFAFYQCQACLDKYGSIDGTYAIPDEVFWQRVKEAQLEKYGRELTPAEITEALKDEHHPLSLLAKDRKSFHKE